MKVLAAGPKPPFTFEDLLRVTLSRDEPFRSRMLTAAVKWGYLTEGTLLTLLDGEERETVKKVAPNGSDPMPLRAALPDKLGCKVEECVYAGKGKGGLHLVLLKGTGGREALVECKTLATLRRRHPEASWWFSRGKTYHLKPVVLLDPAGFLAGRVLGVVKPVTLKNHTPLPPKDRSPLSWMLAETGFKYLKG